MNRIKTQKLREALDLSSYRYVYIQKILNSTYPAYVITYNSDKPDRSISGEKIKTD